MQEGSALAATVAAAVGALGLAWWMLRRAPRRPALNVLVIGGRTGIGAALARELEALGNRVLVASRESELVCNVRDAESVNSAITTAQERMGSVDLLVHVAAISQPRMASLRDTSREDIRDVVETNALGTLHVAREAALLLAPGANVVLCGGAGTSSERVTAGYATYAFTKGGLRQLTKTLHNENRDKRIGFHLIVPGIAITDLLHLEDKTPEALWWFNVLGDWPETMAKYFAPRLCALESDATRPVLLDWLTPATVAWRFATCFWRTDRLVEVSTRRVRPH